MRIAVMQPYLYPYLGYFHLIASVDLFLIFDCVQFPRRGRVHRAPLPPKDRWLTLPLARQPRDICIADLAFSSDADGKWSKQLDGLPWLRKAPDLRTSLAIPQDGQVIDFLDAQLRFACDALGIGTKILRTSSFGIASDLRSQDRVIALAQAAGGTDYVNLPGGRQLYDQKDFAAADLTLSFCPLYNGPFQSMLYALATEPQARLRDDLGSLPAPSIA